MNKLETEARIRELHAVYRAEMQYGTQFQTRAWEHYNEAEGASDGYVEMRGDFRQRAGNDGHGNATNDYKYGQYKEAQAAAKDNAWYMTRAQTCAQMAAMHFAKAAAIQADILRLQANMPG